MKNKVFINASQPDRLDFHFARNKVLLKEDRAAYLGIYRDVLYDFLEHLPGFETFVMGTTEIVKNIFDYSEKPGWASFRIFDNFVYFSVGNKSHQSFDFAELLQGGSKRIGNGINKNFGLPLFLRGCIAEFADDEIYIFNIDMGVDGRKGLKYDGFWFFNERESGGKQ